MIKMPEIR